MLWTNVSGPSTGAQSATGGQDPPPVLLTLHLRGDRQEHSPQKCLHCDGEALEAGTRRRGKGQECSRTSEEGSGG